MLVHVVGVENGRNAQNKKNNFRDNLVGMLAMYAVYSALIRPSATNFAQCSCDEITKEKMTNPA